MLSVTDRAVSKWERGKGCPEVSILKKLAEILDISVDELLDGRSQRHFLVDKSTDTYTYEGGYKVYHMGPPSGLIE